MKSKIENMKSLNVILVFFLLVVFGANKAFATAQFGDLLIQGDDTVSITVNPLEAYFENKDSRTIGDVKMQGMCTALWRGYVATWLLENDSLFLVRIQTNCCSNSPIEIDLLEEFESNRVFAYWVDHSIVKPEGRMVYYVHMGYMSVYEGESFYTIEKGLLTKSITKNYVEKDSKRVFPGESYLSDTIKKLILLEVDSTMRKKFKEKNSCHIHVSFDKKGEIIKIGLGYRDTEAENYTEEVLLAIANEVLKDFPKLMKVNHDRYYPPRIQIWFGGHCLKYPLDKEYGCK